MILHLLLYFLPYVYSTSVANLTFPKYQLRAKDEPFAHQRRSTDNAFLKHKLLNNLNKFFKNGERLEAIEVPDEGFLEDIAEPSKSENIGRNTKSKSLDNTEFPTLVPTEASTTSTAISTMASTATTSKTRSEGPEKDTSSTAYMDTVRKWRKRLYKAFKNRKYHPHKTIHVADVNNKKEAKILDFNDSLPLVVDKNRQVLLSRKEPNWQQLASQTLRTFGKNPDGKIVRMFGMQNSGYNDGHDQPPGITPQPFMLLSNLRSAFRTPNKQPVVYLPAGRAEVFKSQTHRPVYGANPVSSATAPMPASYSLPPMITAPPNVYNPQPLNPVTQQPLTFSFTPPPMPNYPTLSPYPQNPGMYSAPPPPQWPLPPPNVTPGSYGNTIAPYQPQQQTQFNSFVPTEDSDLGEDEMDVFNQDMGFNNDECDFTQDIGCEQSDEKCNSIRLQIIIQNNIVMGNADASKNAVQAAAEAETGMFFDAICGTGFFSYIAHTDEFCLASSGNVNCYVFSPVCQAQSIFGKKRKAVSKKKKKKVYLNKN